jgi:lysophospholipase L1-like esterase
LYEKVAAETGVEFFDAATLIPAADGLDGIHLTPASHKKLGLALADKIRSIAK